MCSLVIVGPQINVSTSLAQREKDRVGLHRQKTKAALIIQLAWRRQGQGPSGWEGPGSRESV